MNLETPVLVVLGLSLVACLLLLYYVRVMIPREMGRRYQDSFRAFSRAVELRFPRLSGQTDQVQRLCRMVGNRLGLDRTSMERLESSAMLRDLGLCAIPYRLLNHKLPEDWTPDELIQFSEHPKIGATMLELIPSLRGIAPIVRDHDQCGPDSSIEAKILAVVNAYVRSRADYGPVVALSKISEEAGLRYDAKVVETLKGMLISTRAAVEFESDVIVQTR